MLEVERTWEVGDDVDPAGFEDAVLAAHGLRAVGRDDVELVATYHDTADFRLARTKATLRRRTGGKDAGWHLKLPAGADREEVQRPLGRAGSAPAALVALTRSRTRGAALGPVLRLVTHRRTLVLADDDGNRVELADDRVTATRLGGSAPGPGTSVAWHEVEAELLTGDRSGLDRAGELLAAAGGRESDWQSKLARALATVPGGVVQGGAVPGVSPGADPRVPTGPVTAVTAYVDAQVDALVTTEPLVRLDRPGAVHDMRVAVRRLRSTLRTFGPLFRTAVLDELDEGLRALAADLGEVRDREVLTGRFTAVLSRQRPEVLGGRPAQALAAEFVTGGDRARRILLRRLDGAGHLQLLDRLETLRAPGALTAVAAEVSADALLELAGAPTRQLRRRARRAVLDADLHRVRRTAKRARYAAEATAPLARGRAQRYLAAVRELQEVLGDHQDAVVAGGVLLTAGVRGPAGTAYAAGVVAGLEQAGAAAAIERFDRVRRGLDRRSLRHWYR